jgi:hypothetical protein
MSRPLPNAEMPDDVRPMAPLLKIDQASKHFVANWRRAASPGMICIASELNRERRSAFVSPPA